MFGGCDDPFTKTSKLLPIGHVQEQFDEANTIVDEHLLERVDLVIGPPPLLGAGQAFDRFDQHTRPYQVRSKIVILPGSGNLCQKRQR